MTNATILLLASLVVPSSAQQDARALLLDAFLTGKPVPADSGSALLISRVRAVQTGTDGTPEGRARLQAEIAETARLLAKDPRAVQLPPPPVVKLYLERVRGGARAPADPAPAAVHPAVVGPQTAASIQARLAETAGGLGAASTAPEPPGTAVAAPTGSEPGLRPSEFRPRATKGLTVAPPPIAASPHGGYADTATDLLNYDKHLRDDVADASRARAGQLKAETGGFAKDCASTSPACTGAILSVSANYVFTRAGRLTAKTGDLETNCNYDSGRASCALSILSLWANSALKAVDAVWTSFTGENAPNGETAQGVRR